MAEERKYRWYFEADDFTNEAVARLTAARLSADTDYYEGAICWDKNKKKKTRKNLRECDFSLIGQLLRARNDKHKIKVFKQELPGGQIVEFDTKIFSKKRALGEKTKKALAEKLRPRS